MAALVAREFLPVKIHIKEQPANFKRFRAEWTPTQIVLDPEGVERHRSEGFLPAEEFLAQLELGIAKVASALKRYDEAERRFRAVMDAYPGTPAAPEARYWAGVAAYKASRGDIAPLRETAKDLEARFPDSEWARKASVWRA